MLNNNAILNEILNILGGNGNELNTNSVLNSIYNTLNGSGGNDFKIKLVKDANDLPSAVSKVITLESDTTYFITTNIDLMGNRIVCNGINTILGTSSETSSITSTGLENGIPLISSAYTLVLNHITIKNVNTAINVGGNVNNAYDWTGTNFLNVPNVGEVNSCGNFIFTLGSFLDSAGLIFKGTIGTIGFNNCLFRSSTGTILSTDASLTITRRFRIIYSSIICLGSAKGISINASSTIPTESYILDTCNFSGDGTYLDGVIDTSNKSLFEKCVGIKNTSVNGQMYMRNNASATTILSKDVFYKVSGTTLPSADNSKYLHSSNKLTCDALIQRKYLIQCSLSFNSGNNNICSFGFYDSTLGQVRTPSITYTTANSSGRAENVSFHCVINHKQGDFIEIHCANNTGATNITITDMNVLITELN